MIAGRSARTRSARHPRLRATGLLLVWAMVIMSGLTRSAPADLTEVTIVAARTVRGPGILGGDVSWPQCSRALTGYDLPMPAKDSGFVIIGLTHGRPFTDNPCLETQLAWAWSHEVPAMTYTMAAHPTDAQLEATGRNGPWAPTTRADRLRNAGYAQARDALRTLDEAGFRPPMVWIDIEHLRKQPWPIGSTAKHKANRHVLTGLMWGFADARMPFGFYSYANGWKEITGGWRLPEVPVWATAGRRDRDAAVAMCERPSFSGGPVLIAQWYNDVRDDDISCIPFTLRPPVPPAPGPPPLPATVASWPPG